MKLLRFKLNLITKKKLTFFINVVVNLKLFLNKKYIHTNNINI